MTVQEWMLQERKQEKINLLKAAKESTKLYRQKALKLYVEYLRGEQLIQDIPTWYLESEVSKTYSHENCTFCLGEDTPENIYGKTIMSIVKKELKNRKNGIHIPKV